MPLSAAALDRIETRIRGLYPEAADEILPQIVERLEGATINFRPRDGRWDETDTVLITYGDMVQDPGMSGLAAVRELLLGYDLNELIRSVHLLPFFPWSSDDGFSVIDYRAVADECGDWSDVDRLGGDFDLMFDLVLNHCSQHSEWFQRFLKWEEPYNDYFITVDPETDVSMVTRPRSLPLLTEYDTADGPKLVWTTFSDDQVDLNFESPHVLVEMIDIFVSFLEHGSRIIRLDAIAYLWKILGTVCIHLPQTHEIVKLMRDVLDAIAPQAILLTETNVPHRENVSYFGDGDEAHMVYQFSLPPLLADAFLSLDAGPLNEWLANLEPCGEGTTYFNFTSSHDGVGVRPLEGLVTIERRDAFVRAALDRGGRVSTKRNATGEDSPYELNITYWDLLGEPGGMETEAHLRRFLSSQAVMLALRGIPGIYFHCLVGTPNDIAGLEQTGQNRRINRRKYGLDELRRLLDDSEGIQARVFEGYRTLLSVRRENPAFHPDSDQVIHSAGETGWIGIERIAADGSRVLSLTNITDTDWTPETAVLGETAWSHNLLTGDSIDSGPTLAPYETLWLTDRTS